MRGRCNRPAPRAIVGWGFSSRSKIDFPSSPSLRRGACADGTAVTCCGLSLRRCPNRKRLACKIAPNSSQIASFGQDRHKKPTGPTSIVDETGGRARQPSGRQAIPPALLPDDACARLLPQVAVRALDSIHRLGPGEEQSRPRRATLAASSSERLDLVADHGKNG